MKGLDIFGEVSAVRKTYECVCPNCGRNMAASRFAPHLEKCMGMGRNSSRIASRRYRLCDAIQILISSPLFCRIASANASKEGGEDSDETSKDDDWTNDKKCRSRMFAKFYNFVH